MNVCPAIEVSLCIRKKVFINEVEKQVMMSSIYIF